MSKNKINFNDWKRCTGCGDHKPIEEFHRNKTTKDGRQSECSECMNERVRSLREKRRYEPEYTLYVSCYNAWLRGQLDYQEPGYEHVLIKWDTFHDFYDELLHDDEFFGQWRKQNNIYKATKKRTDRPSIGRIDHNGHYDRGNIQCEPLGINNANGASKPIQLLISKNMRLDNIEIEEYNTIKEAKQALKQKGFPVNVLMKELDVGKWTIIGSDSVVIQSKDGELKPSEEPLYKLVIDHRREKYDLDTNEVIEVLEHTQYQFNVGGVRFNIQKNSEVQGRPA